MSTKRIAIRLAQAFNATCRAGAIEGQPFSQDQKQIIFDQLALAISDLGDNFAHGKFEDACQPGFSPSQCADDERRIAAHATGRTKAENNIA